MGDADSIPAAVDKRGAVRVTAIEEHLNVEEVARKAGDGSS